MNQFINLFMSHVDAGQSLSKRDRERYYTALVEFVAYGKEPALGGAAGAIFTAIKPTLELSRTRKQNGSKGGSKTQANNQAKSKQTGKQNDKQTTKQNEKQTQNQDAIKTDICSQANGQAISKSKSNSRKEKPSKEGKKKREASSPPNAEQVAAYAASQGWDNFAADEFIDYYSAQGWKLSNGNQMKDWQAAARRWHRTSISPSNAFSSTSTGKRNSSLTYLFDEYGISDNQ